MRANIQFLSADSSVYLALLNLFFVQPISNRIETKRIRVERDVSSENLRSIFTGDFHADWVSIIFHPMLPSRHLLPVNEQRSEHFRVLTFQIFHLLLNAIFFHLFRLDRSRISSRLMDLRSMPSLYRAVHLHALLPFPVRFNLEFQYGILLFASGVKY